MRPQTLDDVIGQDHIVGPGRLLRRAIQADRLSSVIFYGPPGTGKTSLARVIANTTRAYFESLNAVLAGIKDIREAIDRSDERRRLYGRRTILFVDEVHRWNKAQQDALLPWVENGTVILIGATTENPFFEVNRALVSRSRIFQLKPLAPQDLAEAARRTLRDKDRGYGKWKVLFEEGSLEHLVEVAGGDARSLLNAMELSIETSVNWPPPEGSEIHVAMEAAEESIQRRAVLYDRDGDYHFDTISAFIKSVRGSDPDAALYWLAKMVRAGEDPSFIFRRMIILASEDVGLADPHALPLVISCAEAFERIGFPEGNFPLAEACLYLATAPKSNAALGFFDALKEVDREDAEVPNHLRDASRDAESFGHGEGYIYPHAYRDHWAAQQYLPTALKGKVFYTPSRVGYEGRIRDEVLRKREAQAAVVLDGENPEVSSSEGLSWSAASKGREGWFKRLESGRSALLLADRDAVLGQCSIARHDRILIPRANDGLLLWESLRRVPEGLAAALVDRYPVSGGSAVGPASGGPKEALERYGSTLDDPEQPLIAEFSPPPPSRALLPSPAEAEDLFACKIFDHILAREPWKRRIFGGEAAFTEFAEAAILLLARNGDVSLLQSPPRQGERLSRILRDDCGAEKDLSVRFAAAEDSFFSPNNNQSDDFLAWDGEILEKCFKKAGFGTKVTLLDQREERLVTGRDLAGWFDKEKSSWGAAIAAGLGDKDFEAIRRLLEDRIGRGPLIWKWKSILLHGIKKS
ncbi:ATPase AAA [Spirochaetia bacterium]|nr:ATPase AAA [Spirochaetia bacterium]